MNYKKAGGVFAAGILTVSCGVDKNFEDREGDIVAGEPTTVVQRWQNKRTTGKSGPKGYVLYLRTEDCPEGVEPAEGKPVNEECETKDREVDVNTFLAYQDGEGIWWNGRNGASEVQQHRYSREYYFATVYDFGLLVQQCIENESKKPDETCVEDFVQVDFATWYDAEVGDVITFSGDKGDVVSG